MSSKLLTTNPKFKLTTEWLCSLLHIRNSPSKTKNYNLSSHKAYEDRSGFGFIVSGLKIYLVFGQSSSLLGLLNYKLLGSTKGIVAQILHLSFTNFQKNSTSMPGNI